MFTNLKPYPEYSSQSGTISQPPSEWASFRLKSLVRNVVDSASERHVDDPYLALEHVESWTGHIRLDPSALFDSQVKRFESGDVLFGKLRPYLAKVVVPSFGGVCSGEFFVIRPKKPELSCSYLGLLMRSAPMITVIDGSTFGAQMPRADWGFVGTMRIAVPPTGEQAAIVKYLGHANARIDRAIAAKRKLIALLEEHKQAIVNQAVTRGLDPNPPMKDSGIPWIGRIPTHWDVIPTGAAALMIQTGPFGSQLHAEEYIDGGVPVINPSHFSGTGITADPGVSVSRSKAAELARHRLRDGDLIAARRGELGRCAVVGRREVGWICGTGSLIIRLRPEAFCPSYFQLLFSSQQTKAQLEAGSVGATMSNLNAQMVARLRIPKPVLEGQRVIVDAINAEVEKAARRIAAITREIELLREFRTRLTADVVTGQVDIRDPAARLPELDLDDLVCDVGPDEDDLEADLAAILEEVDA